MDLKIDKFTWIVLGIVALLLVAAIVTVNATGGDGWGEAEYLDEDGPAAPVHNAFVALQNGDLSRLRAQYTERVLEEADVDTPYGPLSANRLQDNRSKRLRITDVEVNQTDPEKAQVTFVVDSYSGGGLFDSGSTWSNRHVAEVHQTEDGWKIDSHEFFY